MKQIVKYRILTIPTKVTLDLRITVDDRAAEYVSMFEGNKSTSITCYPVISLALLRPTETDENGQRIRAPWNPNDSIGMTKFSMPVFINELKTLKKDMEIPEMYTYHGKRLELNEALAAKARRVFMIGSTTIELSPVVLIKPEDESRIEGIKMKFNNEHSSVLLTLNEMEALLFNLDHTDVDSLSMILYLNYISKPGKQNNFDSSSLRVPSTEVDIKPKEPEFTTEEI